MPTIVLNQYNTIGFAIILLLVGKWLRKKVSLFEKFAIPAPVIGGLIFAIAALILNLTNVVAFEYDDIFKDLFMIMFFTTIGFNASITVLKKGGKKVVIFLLLATVLCVFQNAISLGIGKVIGMEPGLALMTGSTPMTGGHGTSSAIAPEVEKAGVVGAESVAVASATFGLVAGSLIGGPLATQLIKKRKLGNYNPDGSVVTKKGGDGEGGKLDADKLATAFFMVLIAVGVGVYISAFINSLLANITEKAKMPMYIGPMIIGIILRNITDGTKYEMPMDEIGAVGDISLSIFLAMALMTLKLWQLKDVFGQMSILLLAQTVLMFLYARFVTFKVMGGDYDAAVLAAGHCGFGMGATPNGVANMESVCENYGYSETAFFVLPIVGGMFIDFTNIAVITLFQMFFI